MVTNRQIDVFMSDFPIFKKDLPKINIGWLEQNIIEEGKKEREKFDDTTIRVIDYPEGIKGDPIISDNMNPLLMEYAESVSSDIMKEAKGNNALESFQDVNDDTEEIKDSEGKVMDVMLEPEIVTQTFNQKASKDEGTYLCYCNCLVFFCCLSLSLILEHISLQFYSNKFIILQVYRHRYIFLMKSALKKI